MRRLGESSWKNLTRNTGYSASRFRFCFPITSLFHLWRSYSWCHYNSCFWSFDEVLARYAPLCWHGLPFILLSSEFNAQILGRTPILIIGCGCVWASSICSWVFCWSPLFVVNRWLAVRFNLLSAAVIGVTGLVCLVTPSISAPTAGFALAFASTITDDLLLMVCFKWTWLLTIFNVWNCF